MTHTLSIWTKHFITLSGVGVLTNVATRNRIHIIILVRLTLFHTTFKASTTIEIFVNTIRITLIAVVRTSTITFLTTLLTIETPRFMDESIIRALVHTFRFLTRIKHILIK